MSLAAPVVPHRSLSLPKVNVVAVVVQLEVEVLVVLAAAPAFRIVIVLGLIRVAPRVSRLGDKTYGYPLMVETAGIRS
jgi:hypothetical protein